MSSTTLTSKTADTLVADLQRGDEVAFNRLVSENWDKIFNRANSLLNNYQDAQEVAQDTFIKARKSINAFRGECAIGTWLYHIATNLARNKHWYWWRRKRAQSISFDAPLSDEGVATVGDVISCPSPNPREQALSSEFEEMLPKAVAAMPEKYSDVFNLRVSKHLSYDEIAEQLGLSVGTVKSRLSRAREFLRAELSESEK